MKVSPSLFVPPIKIVIVHWVVLSECLVILFGLRFDMVAFGWLFYGINLGLFGTFLHRLEWQHLTLLVCVPEQVRTLSQVETSSYIACAM